MGKRTNDMGVDWQAIGTLAAMAGVIIAVATLSIQTRFTRISLQTDTLLKLDERFQSEDIKQLRRIASKKILMKDPQNDELGELLEFLGTICFLAQIKAINPELTYKNYSWWMIRYWLSAKDYIQQTREVDPLSWVTMEKEVGILKRKELKEGYSPADYSEEKLTEFCNEEARIPVRIKV
jgi:hypothetical protein